MKNAGWVLGTGLFLSILGSGCDLLGPACTLLMFCDDVLIVEMEGQLPDEFTLTAEADGEEPRIRECSPSTSCGSTFSFEDFTPSQVKLTFQSVAGSIEQTFSPDYEVVTPNGPDCPPKCRQGTVHFQTD